MPAVPLGKYAFAAEIRSIPARKHHEAFAMLDLRDVTHKYGFMFG
ncbi:MAG: hypothetical protein ACREDL_15235 [Bradyrhizobium sp.]